MLRKSPEVQSTPEFTYNLNDEVRVKVTSYGEELWNEHYTNLRLACKRPDAYPLTRDEEGYTALPLWKVMNIFGAHIGSDENPPIDANIQFYK